MKFYVSWTKVLAAFLIFLAVHADGTSSKLAPKSAPQPKNITAAEIKVLLKKIKIQKMKCMKEKCSHQKLYEGFETILLSFLSTKERLDIVGAENETLKTQAKVLQLSMPLTESRTCLKPRILSELMLNVGITDVGDKIYSKRLMGNTGAACWSNSKKKKEATVVLCNFPLAINIQTKGGTVLAPIIRQREYTFDLKGCNPISVRVHDQDIKGDRETVISYQTCIEQWNKRTADAAMTKGQVRSMEDTIGFCFRHHLLPPHESAGYRDNPVTPSKPKS